MIKLSYILSRTLVIVTVAAIIFLIFYPTLRGFYINFTIQINPRYVIEYENISVIPGFVGPLDVFGFYSYWTFIGLFVFVLLATYTKKQRQYQFVSLIIGSLIALGVYLFFFVILEEFQFTYEQSIYQTRTNVNMLPLIFFYIIFHTISFYGIAKYKGGEL